LLSFGLCMLQFASGAISGESHKIATLSVYSGEFERFDTPLVYQLDGITNVYEADLSLYEVIEGGLVPVEVQFSSAGYRSMHWLLAGRTEPGKTRIFELRQGDPSSGPKTMSIKVKQDAYVLYSGDKQVFQYNSGIMLPPEGANPAYRRSGFIHPLYAPNGALLTNIQPPDHLHHYGLWNPWTKTTFRGEEIDFWNLAKEQGRVRFSGLASVNEGSVFGSIQVHHEHVSWPYSLRETIAMNELQEVRAYDRNDGLFLLDITSRLSPAEEITFEEYRYGGFTLRATEYWTNKNSFLFTSEGLDRDNAEGERARWCVVSGDTPQGRASILMMGHPANYNHPEPLRVWATNANRGRGDQFINFSPTRNTQWVLEPGKNYLLRYRMIVSEGEIDKHRAGVLWNDFSNPPEITVVK
jgi:hypothetical protein